MADKHLILDGNSLADECVRRDLAARTYYGVFLYFYERADPAVVSDRAAIKVYLVGVMDFYVSS
jgi:hypothetical protein